jgi:hypothetical protein
MSRKPTTGLVVPTLGTRQEYLRSSLESIRQSGDVHIAVVAPTQECVREVVGAGLVDQFVQDPGGGPGRAIDCGIRQLPAQIRFVNWLGDDDLLEPFSMTLMSSLLEHDNQVGFVYGQCRYIDSEGKEILLNRSGQWAASLMRFGPDLVPQPGSLFRRELYVDVGGLDFSLGWAFDLDLFIKFSKRSRIQYQPSIVSSFRWHQGSLSVGSRSGSVAESSRVRKAHLPSILEKISEIWELPVRHLSKVLGGLPMAQSTRKTGRRSRTRLD